MRIPEKARIKNSDHLKIVSRPSNRLSLMNRNTHPTEKNNKRQRSCQLHARTASRKETIKIEQRGMLAKNNDGSKWLVSNCDRKRIEGLSECKRMEIQREIKKSERSSAECRPRRVTMESRVSWVDKWCEHLRREEKSNCQSPLTPYKCFTISTTEPPSHRPASNGHKKAHDLKQHPSRQNAA